MFCFNEFAFTVQVKHKINNIQILGFILICCILRLAISTHLYFAKSVAYFPFNSWLTFQRLCRLLWGRHILWEEWEEMGRRMETGEEGKREGRRKGRERK